MYICLMLLLGCVHVYELESSMFFNIEMFTTSEYMAMCVLRTSYMYIYTCVVNIRCVFIIRVILKISVASSHLICTINTVSIVMAEHHVTVF